MSEGRKEFEQWAESDPLAHVDCIPVAARIAFEAGQLSGIRIGLEAAAKIVNDARFDPRDLRQIRDEIRYLSPEEIQKEQG